MNNPEREFQAAIAAAGLTPPDTIEPGRIHRFPGAGKGRGNTAGRCFMFPDMRGGWYEDYSSGLQSNWQASGSKPYTQAERQANIERSKAANEAYREEKDQAQAVAAVEAEKRFNAAGNCTQHAYLTTKGVKAYGIKQNGDSLLIPMRDKAGRLRSLQTIAPDGDKRFQKDGEVTGCYHAIGKPSDKLIITEGYATGASAHESTGEAVAVAFNAGNLEPVALALRAKYPALKIIIAADDDYLTASNPGISAATAAALAVGGFLAVPDFGAGRPDKATDFNDLHQFTGLQAVKACIEAATPVVTDAASDAGAVGQLRKPDGVVLSCGSDLTPEPVRWLWPNWLALGKFHILAGAPGQGKTTIAISLAATITSNGRWPDGIRCNGGNVLIWSGEDDPADTLLPRLLAAGGDRSKVFFINASRINGEELPFDPARDMGQLLTAMEKVGNVKLLIVDPVVGAVTGDSHKNTEVRRALQPLVDLAAACNCALLGITHFSKGGQGSDPSQRVIGSVAFTAVARVVLVAAKVKSEDGEDTRILARSKSNIGPDDGGFQYQLEQVDVQAFPGIAAARIKWGKAVEGNARELLTDPDDTPGDGNAPGLSDACELLKEELHTIKETSAELASKALKDAGFSKKQIWAASKKLGVIRRKDGMTGGWVWRLPSAHDAAFITDWPNTTEDSTEDSEGSNFKSRESSESSGAMESSSGEIVEVEF